MIPEAHKLAALEFWRRGRVRTPLVLEGDCMSPMLSDGDVIVIAHGDDRPRFGDIVAFRRDGRVLVQRVVGTCAAEGRTVYEVRPDAQGLRAVRVARGAIVGRVVEVRHADERWDLRSAPWRLVGLIMACRSYVGVRRSGRSPVWRVVSWLLSLRARLLRSEVPLGVRASMMVRPAASGQLWRARKKPPRGVQGE